MPTPIVGEAVVPGPVPGLEGRLLGAREEQRSAQFSLADHLNRFQQEVTTSLLSGFSSGRYRSRRFVDTGTFRRLAVLTLRRANVDLDGLARGDHVPEGVVQRLKRGGIVTVADLFEREPKQGRRVDPDQVADARTAVIDALMRPTRRPR